MRILQLVKWLSPRLDSGGKIRSFELAGLLASFAEVDVIGFAAGRERFADMGPFRKIYRNVVAIPRRPPLLGLGGCLAGVLAGGSLRTSHFRDARYRAALLRLVSSRRYDAVQAEELPMARMLMECAPPWTMVFSAHNAESALSAGIIKQGRGILRALAPMEQRRTAAEEAAVVRAARFCFAVSAEDRDELRRLGGPAAPPIHVIPNCAGDRFSPPPAGQTGNDILVTGCFGWRPNAHGIRWFAGRVMPILKRSLPGRRVRVVGSGIDPSLARFLEHSGCSISRDVPDILPFLRDARALVVPLHVGGGSRIKIIEAWAAGAPVVSTTTGAAGLGCVPGSDILIADTPEEFAARVRQVSTDDALHGRLRTAGLKRAESLRWSRMRATIEEIYAAGLARSPSEEVPRVPGPMRSACE